MGQTGGSGQQSRLVFFLFFFFFFCFFVWGGAVGRDGEVCNATHIIENKQLLGPTTIGVADGIKKTVPDKRGDELFDEEGQEDTANYSQDEVVDEEERLELERLSVTHHLATTKNGSIVQDNEYRRLLKGRKWRLARHKAKVIGRVSHQNIESLIKVGPQLYAKWTVQCW